MPDLDLMFMGLCRDRLRQIQNELPDVMEKGGGRRGSRTDLLLFWSQY